MNVYDFDKTIYKKDCSVQFYLFCIRKSPWIFCRCIYRQIFAFITYKLNKINKEQLKEAFFCFLNYIDTFEFVDLFVEAEIENINTWYIEKKSESDVVISASPDFLVEAFMGKIGSMKVIASHIDPQTGLFNGKNCYGLEKVRRFSELFGDTIINEFYTDSKSDMPLAEKAQRAFLVKKSRILSFPYKK